MLNLLFIFLSTISYAREKVKISAMAPDKSSVTFNTGKILGAPHDLIKVAEDCVVEITTASEGIAIAATDLCVNKSKLRIKKTGYYVALDDKIEHSDINNIKDKVKMRTTENTKPQGKSKESEPKEKVEYIFIDREEPSHLLIGASLGYMQTTVKNQLNVEDKDFTSSYGLHFMYYNKFVYDLDWSFKVSYYSSDTSWANNEISIYYPINSRWKAGVGFQLATLMTVSYEDNPPSGLGTGAQATLTYKWNRDIFLHSTLSTVLFSSDKISQPDINIYGIQFSIHKIIFE